jgi:hypothetical protein
MSASTIGALFAIQNELITSLLPGSFPKSTLHRNEHLDTKGASNLPDIFFNNLWPGMVAWSILYVSDYALTITCAHLYRAGANEKIVFEGSYEITPYFQNDINSLRLISPRFLAMLLLSTSLLVLMWVLTRQSQPQFYQFVLGSMILLELTIHVRHLRNFFLFRSINYTDAVRGRIEYSRALMLRMSSLECFVFSGLYLVLFMFTQSWFILGGVAGLFSLAVKHRRLAAKLPKSLSAAAQSQ